MYQQVYRTLFEESTIPSYIIDVHYRIQDANDALCSLLNYSSSDLKGRDLQHFFLNIDEYQATLEKIHTGAPVEFTVQVKDFSGGKIDCNATIKPLMAKDGGQTTGFLGTLEKASISNAPNNEMLFRESLNTCRRIARSMGHEIRNPLTNLTLAVDQLSDELEDLEEHHLYFDIINRNAARIEKLVSAILESTKLDDLHLQSEDLNCLIPVWVETIKNSVGIEGVDIEFNLEENIPICKVDLNQLGIAFRNIFLNAYKSVSGKQNAKIEVSTHLDKSNIIVEIKDNGIGIAKEDLPEIFSPFFSGEGKWGLGLGLTQAKSIINAHNGKVSVDSELGKGSTFSIWLKGEVS